MRPHLLRGITDGLPPLFLKLFDIGCGLMGMVLCALIAAGCGTVTPSAQTLWLEDTNRMMTLDQSQADPPGNAAYDAFIRGLRPFKNRLLWETTPAEQLALLHQIDRIRHSDIPPAFVCDMTSPTGRKYTLFVEAWKWAEDSGLSSPAVRTTLIMDTFPFYVTQMFSIGRRTIIGDIKKRKGPSGSWSMLEFYLNPWGTSAIVTSREANEKAEPAWDPTVTYLFAVSDLWTPQLVLIRAQKGKDGDAQWPIFAEGRHLDEELAVPGFVNAGHYDVSHWDGLFDHSDDVHILASLFYLGGDHFKNCFVKRTSKGLPEGDYWEPANRTDEEFAKFRRLIVELESFKALSKHPLPWVREMAAYVKKQAQVPDEAESKEPSADKP